MRRLVWSALVVAVALLAISAQPVGAANVAVASTNTTFGTGGGEAAPTTLTNMTVSGSGSSATVELGSQVDGFEDQDLSNFAGDTGSYSIASDSPYQGTYHVNGGGGTVVDTSSSYQTGQTARVYAEPDSSSSYAGLVLATGTEGQSANEFYTILINPNNGVELRRYDSGGSKTTLGTDTGVSISAGTYYELELETTAGGSVIGTVSSADGTQLSQVSSGDATYDPTYRGFFTFNNGDFDEFEVASEPLQSATYIGAPHDAENVVRGDVNITTLTDGEATVTWEEDGNGDGTWSTVAQSTTTTAGVVQTDLSGVTADRWRARVEFSATGPAADIVVSSESVLADTSTPAGSNPAPTGQTDSYGGNVTINVTDSDFGTPQGDAVNVSVASGGQTVGSTTLTSNDTATIAYSAVAGENDLNWTLTDEYGNSETVNQSFSTPAELEVRREVPDDHPLITSAGNVSITYYAGEEVETRDISGGVADLTGLPAGERIIADVSADGYYSRRVVIPSLYEQQTVYLLNESETANEVQFEIEDQTLTYTSESVLYVEKPITVNGTTEYRVLVADEFGVGGLTTRLVPDARYRLRIVNDEGQEVVLGSYTADVAEVVTLRPEPGRIGISDDEEDYAYSASLDNQTLVVDYYDPTNTSDVTLAIVERGNHSNTLEPNQTYDDLGRVTYQTSLTANETNQSWVVLIDGTRQGNETVDVRIPVDRGANLVPNELGFVWRFGLVTLVLVLSAALWGQFSVGLGATITGVVGGFLWWFGFLDGIASGAAVAIAIGVGAMVRLYEGGPR